MPRNRLNRTHFAVSGVAAAAISLATLMGVDVSHYQPVSDDARARFLIAKASDGTSYTDPMYLKHRHQAAIRKTPFGAYHFLRAGNTRRQAHNAFKVVGAQIPLIVDAETSGGPTFRDVRTFVAHYRRLGGRVTLLYLSHSYWESLGRPDLSVLREVSLYNADYALASGAYPGNDSPAWSPYGNLDVALLQYSDGDGQLDHDAFRGTRQRLCELLHCW